MTIKEQPVSDTLRQSLYDQKKKIVKLGRIKDNLETKHVKTPKTNVELETQRHDESRQRKGNFGRWL